MWSIYNVLLYPLEVEDAEDGSWVLCSECGELTTAFDVLDRVLEVVWAGWLERGSSSWSTFLVFGHDVDNTFVENSVDGLLTTILAWRT